MTQAREDIWRKQGLPGGARAHGSLCLFLLMLGLLLRGTQKRVGKYNPEEGPLSSEQQEGKERGQRHLNPGKHACSKQAPRRHNEE